MKKLTVLIIIIMLLICACSNNETITESVLQNETDSTTANTSVAKETSTKEVASTEKAEEIKKFIEIDFTDVFNSKSITVTYKEKTSNIKKRSIKAAWEGDINFDYTVEPFVVDEKDSFSKLPQNSSVEFIFGSDNEYREYGYIYNVEDGRDNLEYISDNFGFFSIRNIIDSKFTGGKDVELSIVNPDNIDVYTPYEQIADGKYLIKSTDMKMNPIWKGGAIIIGDFDSTKTIEFEDHVLNIHLRGIDMDDYRVQFTEFIYSTIYNKIYKDNPGHLNKNMNIVYFNDYPEFFRFEGMKGAQIEIIGDRNLSDFTMSQENEKLYWLLTQYESHKDFGRIFVHQLVHATIDDSLIDYWGIEGIADYLMPKMLGDFGLYTDEQAENEYIRLVNDYNTKVVEKGDDIALNDTMSYSPDPDYTGWFHYQKGAIVFLYIDKVIMELTNNEKDIYDYLNLYLKNYEKYGKSKQNMESTLSELTGHDFTGFIDGITSNSINNPIPIKVVDGVLVVSY